LTEPLEADGDDYDFAGYCAESCKVWVVSVLVDRLQTGLGI
jgi:hypothetical protein